MSECYIWCDSCNKQHESREICPKGWVLSLWELKYVSQEESRTQIKHLKNIKQI